MALAVSAFALASCMQQEEDVDGAVGYLCAPALDVDVTVEDLIDTKALEGFVVDEPGLADFRYVVKDKDGAVKYDGTGLWEPLGLPAGKYSVEAYHGENGFGIPYFYGKTPADAVIVAMQQNTPQLTAKVQNALVRVRVDSDFAGHFTLKSVELTSGGESETLTAARMADWYFVPSEAELSIKLIGENKAGVYKDFTHVITPAPRSASDIVCRQDGNNIPSIILPEQTAGAWATRLYVTPAIFTNISAANQAAVVYEVIPEGGDWTSAQTAEQIQGPYYVAKDLTNGARYTVRARVGSVISGEQTVTVTDNLPGTTVSMVHDNNDDPSVMLSGTNVAVDLKLSGVLKSLHDTGLLQFSTSLKKDGTLVRTSTVAAGLMTGETSSWPYLPQGNDYELTVSHKLSSETSYISSSAIGGFVSKAPVFGITLGKSYTAYDYGVGNAVNGFSKNTDKANNECKPESLYDAGVSWNISSTLMSSDLYKTGRSVNVFLTQGGTPKATYAPESLSTSTKYDVGEITDLEWKRYEVKAEVSFDNVRKTTETRTHHITGLPYKIARPDNTGDHAWSGTGQVDWNWGDGVKLYPNRNVSKITFDHFYVPDINGSLIDVYVNYTFKRYDTGFRSLYFSVIVGTTEVEPRADLDSNSERTYPRTSKVTTLTTSEKSVVMTAEYGAANIGSFYSAPSLFEVLYR